MNFWQTLAENIVANAAAIIASLTGFGGMVGGFYIQYRTMKRQFDDQNRKLDQNASVAQLARKEISDKVDSVHVATNGLTAQLVAASSKVAYAAGVLEGQATKAPPA